MPPTPPFDASGAITPQGLAEDLLPFVQDALKDAPVVARLVLSRAAPWLVRVVVDVLVGRYGAPAAQALRAINPLVGPYLKPEVLAVLDGLLGLFETPPSRLHRAAGLASQYPPGKYP